MADWPKEKLYDVKSSAGLLAPGLEMKIVNEKGQEVKADGKEWGEILLRGPWIAKEYYKDPERSKPVFRGGLAPHGRRGDDRRGGLCPSRGPDEGPRQERRGVDLLRRPGEPHHGPSGHRGGRRDRHPPQQMGGAPPGLRRRQAGLYGHGGGAQGVPAGQGQGRLVDPGPLRLPGPDPQNQRGEVQQKDLREMVASGKIPVPKE